MGACNPIPAKFSFLCTRLFWGRKHLNRNPQTKTHTFTTPSDARWESIGRQLVSCHGGDRLWLEKALSEQASTVEKHLHEMGVIHGRGYKAATP